MKSKGLFLISDSMNKSIEKCLEKGIAAKSNNVHNEREYLQTSGLFMNCQDKTTHNEMLFEKVL